MPTITQGLLLHFFFISFLFSYCRGLSRCYFLQKCHFWWHLDYISYM